MSCRPAVWTMLASLLFMTVAVPVSANVGIPMVSCIHPGFWFLLPIVIVVEWLAALLILRKGVWITTKVSVIANLVSTLVGLPIKWLVVWVLMPIGIQYADKYPPHHATLAQLNEWWNTGSALQKFAMNLTVAPIGLAPTEAISSHWIRLSWGILLVPFFLLSVLVERWIAVKLISKDGRKRATIWALIANTASYAIIFMIFWRLWWFTWIWIDRHGY